MEYVRRVQKHAEQVPTKQEIVSHRETSNRIMICNVGSVVAVSDQPMIVDVAAIVALELLHRIVCACHVIRNVSLHRGGDAMSVFAMVQVTLNVALVAELCITAVDVCLNVLEITIATEEVVHDAVHVRQGMDGTSIVIVIAIGIQVVDSLGGVTGTIGGERFGIVGDDIVGEDVGGGVTVD